jgi:penicillin-binding protein 2
MDVVNGDVLAMASTPTFDPNVFGRGIRPEEWNALLKADHAPLSNKAIAGQYAPGSTFKMVTGLAGIEHGVMSPGTVVFCGGHVELGDSKFHCWRRGGHGSLNMVDAIIQSCDVYFYEAAKRVGVDRLAATAARFGLGKPVGIELPNERPGLMPTRNWKRARFNKPWAQGETLIAGIGQGYVLTTPLQLAVMTARLVNGGRAVVPRIVRPANSEGRVLAEAAPPKAPTIDLPAEALRTMVRAMAGVTMHPRGTAHGSRIMEPQFAMGGKTGTSQVRRISAGERARGVKKNSELDWEERDHALFVGFAPLDNPRYACAVIVEHGGGGSAVAAPIARDLLLETQRRDPSRRSDPPLQAQARPVPERS